MSIWSKGKRDSGRRLRPRGGPRERRAAMTRLPAETPGPEYADHLARQALARVSRRVENDPDLSNATKGRVQRYLAQELRKL